MRPSIAKAVVAGLIATAILTLIMYFVAPLMLGEPMDVAQMLGDMLGIGWTAGMILHFINGTIIFPLVYVYVLYKILPGAPWMKGLIWGLILWLISELVVTPMAGGGVFHSNAPNMVMAVMGGLLGHAVWGAVFGAIAGGGERV